MKFSPQAVIFDMDGLLVDSEPLWWKIESGVLASHGKVYNADLQKGLIGMRMDEFWANMVRIYGIPESPKNMIREVTHRMVELVPEEVHARPGAPELLAYLAAEGVPCAIASSSPLMIIDAVVAAQGWEHYFKARVSGDEVKQGKPAPDVYLEAARRIGCPPERCLALEDSKNGARAAVAAGMTCIAVPDLSHGHHRDFEGITPYVVDSLHDVLELLKRNGG